VLRALKLWSFRGGVVKKGSEKSGFEPPGVKHNI